MIYHNLVSNFKKVRKIMIVTNLFSPDLALYSKINQNFAKVFEIAKDALTNIPEVAKYDIDGKNAFYMIQEYDTKSPEAARYETHKKYIDVQIILKGEEEIRFETLDKLTPQVEYIPDKDIAFWNMTDEYDSVRLIAGELSIIFPDEPHAPSLSASPEESHVVKLIAKILL